MHGPMNATFSPSLVNIQNCTTVFDQRNQAFRTLCSEKPNYDFDKFRQFRVSWLFNPFTLSLFDFPSLRRYNFVLENIFNHLPPLTILRALLEKSGQRPKDPLLCLTKHINHSNMSEKSLLKDKILTWRKTQVFEIFSHSVTIPLVQKADRFISLPWAETQTPGSTQPPTTRNRTAVTES
jgi:hypothetical protein